VIHQLDEVGGGGIEGNLEGVIVQCFDPDLAKILELAGGESFGVPG
jgi:hypothetical protein